MVTSKDYLRILESWLVFAKKFLYQPGDRPDLECFGTGYNNWAVQTHQKAFSAFAVCSTDPEIDEKKCKMKRSEILEHALKMFRFNLQTHIEGNHTCLDGTKWGHTWISVLGMERMMHGIHAIKDYLTDEDRQLLKKVMISESDWLVDDYFRDMPEEKGRVFAGKTLHNHPESNIWNGAHLLRTVLMFPEVKRRQEYLEKAISFIINGISVSSDAKDKNIIYGKPVSAWYINDNFFPSFALNHHGYLNVGYMVICLSNIAMLHFAYKMAGFKPPEFIYRHCEELWRLVKCCTFPDGRLCRIGGDTRIRYCYCQDYSIIVWLFVKDVLGDNECESFERRWLEIVKKEMLVNGDGSFLSTRCKDLSEIAPIYFLRLETDRAATISMASYWKRTLNLNEPEATKAISLKQPWFDDYHGGCLVRGKNRIASWCWEAAQPPQGMCVSVKHSNLVEWKNNLAGSVCGYGRINYQKPVYHKEFLFDYGFVTIGETEIHSEFFISEGQTPEIIARNILVFVALGDDSTCIIMQKCIAGMPGTYIRKAKGLFLNIPNDIFNDCARNYWFEGGCKKLKGPSKKQEKIDIYSRWVNVDDCLGIVGFYGSRRFTIYRPTKRQAGLKLNTLEAEAMDTGLFVDEICYPYMDNLSLEKGDVIFDICCAVLAGTNHMQTGRFSQENLLIPEIMGQTDDVRVAGARGFDGRWYLLIANTSEKITEIRIKLQHFKKARSLITKKRFPISGITGFSIGPRTIELLMIE